jgi:hypothetical protein
VSSVPVASYQSGGFQDPVSILKGKQSKDDSGIYFLTFDFGTESLRGALFNEQGNMLNTACRIYTTLFPHPGWAKQIPA